MDTQPLAYMSQEFLESGDARPLRIMAEYLEPHRRFRTEKIRDTVVFFGSARIRSREASRTAARGGAAAVRASSRHSRPTRSAAAERAVRVVALLRRRARARAPPDHAGRARCRVPATASSSARVAARGSWRRPTAARTRPAARRWAEHPAALRTGRQPLHLTRPEFRVPLLLHAEVLVRLPRQGGDRSFPAASARSTSCSRS